MTTDTGWPAADEQHRAPEQNPALVRVLKIAVIGMGVLILAGLAAVIWRIVHLASSPKDNPATIAAPIQAQTTASPSALTPELMLALPEGAAVRSVILSANRLAVHYDAAEGTGIAIVDLETGRTVSRVRITGPRP